jgi:serine/threonine protein kinase
VTQIGKYQIVEQVGEGAMGVVYKALDPVLNRTVAVKVMSEGLAQDPGLRERFLREAQSAGSLQHPNLVTIYDFGETDGHLFIAMEYIEGIDLEKLMDQNAPMPLPVKLDLIIDVLNGLSYAHRRGIIHRDIKPANIRIDQEGRGRIMDFGVARMETSNLTGTGTMMGTPNYMAPEQISGGPLTPAADLWSVGAMLYEMLTNKKPFAADTLHRVLFKIVSDAPPDLLAAAPGLPAALDEIVKKSLMKDPAQRYRTASEMANAVAAVRAKMGAARSSRTVSPRSSIEKELEDKRVATARSANRGFVLIGGGIAAALGLAMVGYIAFRPDPPAVTPTLTVAPPPVSPATAPAPAVTPPPPPVASSDANVATKTPASPLPPTRQTKAPATKTAPLTADTRPIRVDTPRVAVNAPPQTAPATQGNTTSAAPLTPVAPPPVAVSTPVPVATSPAPLPVPENPRPAISSIIEAYERAIGTRQVAEVKRVYVGMTPQQQSSWEGFFSSIRSITANLAITSLEVNGATAVARLTGAYEYVTRAGRSERQPASFQATFQREGDRWTLQSVR